MTLQVYSHWCPTCGCLLKTDPPKLSRTKITLIVIGLIFGAISLLTLFYMFLKELGAFDIAWSF